MPSAESCLLFTPESGPRSTIESSPHFDTWQLSIHSGFLASLLVTQSGPEPVLSPPVSPLQGGLHLIWLPAGTGSQKQKSSIWHILQTTDHPRVHCSLPPNTHYLLWGQLHLRNLFVVSSSTRLPSEGPIHLSTCVLTHKPDSRIQLFLSGSLSCPGLTKTQLCSQ